MYFVERFTVICPHADIMTIFHHGEKDISGLAQIEKGIRNIRENVSQFYRSLVLIQSSGTGKTQICIDLGRNNRCVYFSCQLSSSETSAGFISPQVVQDMLLFLHTEASSCRQREIIISKILFCLVEAAKEYAEPLDLFNAQLQPPYPYYSRLSRLWEENKKSPLKVAFAAAEEAGNLNPCEFNIDDEDNLIVVVDEASLITQKDENPDDRESNIRCFLRQVNKSSLVTLLLSTSSKIAFMMPTHVELTTNLCSRLTFQTYFPRVSSKEGDHYGIENMLSSEQLKL